MCFVYCTIAPPPPPPPTTPNLGRCWRLWPSSVLLPTATWGSVILIYRDKRKKRTRRKPCAPGAVKGGRNQQLKCGRRFRPFEQLAQKIKATCPLMPRQSMSPTSLSSPTRWEIVRDQVKGRFKDFITPPLENIADLPRNPASSRWQILPEGMGKINIGMVEEGNRSVMVLTNSHGELYQQVVVNKTVDNATAHSLLISLLGDGYRKLVPSLTSLHNSSFLTAPPPPPPPK